MNAKVFFVAFAFLCLTYSIEGSIIRRSADKNETTPAASSVSNTTEPSASTKPEENDQNKQGQSQEVTTKAAELTEVKTEVATTPASSSEGQTKIDTTTANSTVTDIEQKEKAVGGLIALYWLLSVFRGGQ